MELGFYRFANKEPNKLAIVGPNEELVSRGELLSKANKLTHALRDLGLKKFDTVAVVLPNSVEYFVVYMACLQAGFYLVPINWHLAGPEIAYILEDSEAKAFIASGKNPDMEKACINERKLWQMLQYQVLNSCIYLVELSKENIGEQFIYSPPTSPETAIQCLYRRRTRCTSSLLA